MRRRLQHQAGGSESDLGEVQSVPLRARAVPRPHLQDGEAKSRPSHFHERQDCSRRGKVKGADLRSSQKDIPRALQIQEAAKLSSDGSRQEIATPLKATQWKQIKGKGAMIPTSRTNAVCKTVTRKSGKNKRNLCGVLSAPSDDSSRFNKTQRDP